MCSQRFFAEHTALDTAAILNDLEPSLKEVSAQCGLQSEPFELHEYFTSCNCFCRAQEVGMFLLNRAVATCYLFDKLPAKLLNHISMLFQPTIADVGSEIVTKGTEGDTLFIIQSGTCQVVDEIVDSTMGISKRKTRLKAGRSFGEARHLSDRFQYWSAAELTQPSTRPVGPPHSSSRWGCVRPILSQ